MIRRARLSFKPNVRPGGRAAGPGGAGGGRDGGAAPPAEPDPGTDPKTAGPGESSTAPVTGDPAQPEPQEKGEPIEPAAPASTETPPSKTASAPLQRRKRISTLPNLAKPRVSNSAPAVVPPPKPSPVDVPSAPPVTTAPYKTEGSPPEKGKVLSTQKPQVPLSPPQGQHVTLPEKRTPVPQVPQFSPYKKSVLKHQELSPVKAAECPQKEEPSPLKERPSQKSCSNELFEVVKKTSQKKVVTNNLEKERLRRAQKLRDLLKAELRKERKAWRAKHPVINLIVEPEKSKMMMRDFIHFIPVNNPMSSSLEESRSSEKSSPLESQLTGSGGKNSAEEDDLDDDDNEEDDSQLLAPRVKVAEDGSIILDEESLTVEVSRNKAPIVEGNDPIFERGSTTTYSSFRRNTYSKPWSDQETDMFFLAISMVGTDFSMIGQLFPHRERIEIKNKFKKEERVNGWRIDKAFREKKDFDFEFFAQLLEKALEAGKKKKTRSKQPRKTNTKPRKKQKDKIAAEQSLCDEESVISEEEGADARTAEKENKRSPEADECSEVADPAPVKKKRAKKKKENAKETEEENRESQDDDLTQTPKKEKPKKNKTAAQDTDKRPELQSVDGDGSLKDTVAEKKTRVQKNKPNYNESELEDDENDEDCEITEDFEAEDVHVSCEAGEADPLSQSVIPSQDNSLILFSEESDYQSGPDDLSGVHQSLSEVSEAVPQAPDVSPAVPNVMLSETEPTSVTQEETSSSACDKFDTSAKTSDAGSGQPGEQDSEPKDKQKMLQGRRAGAAPNLSQASIKKKESTEEQSDTKHQTDLRDDLDVGKSDKKILQQEGSSVDQQRQMEETAKADDSSTPHNGQKDSSIKSTLMGKGRFQRPKPNLPARTLTRREKLDVTDTVDVPNEETEKCADVSDGRIQDKKEDTGNLNLGEIDASSAGDKHRQDGSVQVSSPVKEDVGSESDLPQSEESNTVQQDCEKGDTRKESPSLPVRERFRPKPNLTRAPAKIKSSDTEHESPHSQGSGQVSQVGIKPPPHTQAGDQESEIKERVESSSGSQDECEKSSIKPAPLARGRFQRPKPNLVKASSRKETTDDKEVSSAQSAGHAEGETSREFQSDHHCGKQENEMVKTGSASSQDTCDLEINSHPSSSLQVTQDSTASQDHWTEASNISETQSIQSPVEPAPLARGRLQKPKPNLVKASGRKGEFGMKESESFEDASDTNKKSSAGDDLNSSIVKKATELVKEAPSVEPHMQEVSSLEKPDSMLPLKVDSENLSEEPNTTLKPAVLPKGRFQRPKPNLGRAATRRDGLTSPETPKNIPKVEAPAETALASKEATSNIPVNKAETAHMLAESNKESCVSEEDSVTLEKPNSGASPETPLDATPAMTDKEPSASDDEKKTLKPVLTRARFQRPKPNLNKSATRSAAAAPLMSSAQEEKRRTEASSTDNGQVIDKNPEIELAPDTSITGHSCKEAEHAIEEKSGAIKPAQLKRGRIIRPVPNLVKPSTKTLSLLQSKTNKDLNSSPTCRDKDHLVARSSPATKRKASDCNVDLSPKRICPSGTPRKPSCLSDSEVDQVSLSNEPESSSQSTSVQDMASLQCSRFGRPLRKLSTPPSVSPKSENSSDRPEKEKATRNVKSTATKVSKPVPRKTTLVKIRATQQEEDDEEDGDLGFEEENYDLAPDMQNQAPVFIPFSLRSPRPVTAEIEETVEELEIPVDVVDLPNNINQDLGRTAFQQIEDLPDQPDKKEQCDGSAEAAMTLISMGSSVYESNIGEFVSPECTKHHKSSLGGQNNQEELTSVQVTSSPSRNLLTSPHHNVCAMESSVTVDPRVVDDPLCSPSLENKTQTDVICSDSGSAENLPNPVNDNLAYPIEQIGYPVMQGNALLQDFSSQDVSVSDCLLGGHDAGEEATFILTLVEIPINEDYAYSCDANMAESLPAPVLISSGSSQALSQNLNPSVETVSYEPSMVGQEEKDVMVEKTSRKRGAECMDEGDHNSLQKKPLLSEQVVDEEIKATAVEEDGERKVAPEDSVPEPMPEEAAAVSHISGTAVKDRRANWQEAKSSAIVPVEMPGTSMTDSLNRNLPLYSNPVTTSKTLKRPGKKPLGFLSLVCKEKQPKKAQEENQKKKNPPKPKCRKISPVVRGPQKESPDLNNLENANDSEVPSSPAISSPAEKPSTPAEQALPSVPQISDHQDTEVQTPSCSHDLATEEEAAPVSEYFFSDIFMEVDD